MSNIHLEKVKKIVSKIEIPGGRLVIHIDEKFHPQYTKMILQYCDERHDMYDIWKTQHHDGSIYKWIYLYFEKSGYKLQMTQSISKNEESEEGEIFMTSEEFFDIAKGKKKKLDI